MKRLDIPKKQLLNKHFSIILLFPHQEDRIWNFVSRKELVTLKIKLGLFKSK